MRLQTEDTTCYQSAHNVGVFEHTHAFMREQTDSRKAMMGADWNHVWCIRSIAFN